MSIKAKLVLVFIVLLGLLIGMASVTLFQVSEVADSSAEVGAVTIGRIEHASHIRSDLPWLRALELQFLESRSPSERQALLKEMNDALKDIQIGINQYAATLGGKRPARWELFLVYYQDYSVVHNKLVSLAEADRKAEASGVFYASDALFRTMEDEIHQLRHEEYGTAESAWGAWQALKSRMWVILGMAFMVTAAVELAIGWYLSRYFSSQFGALLKTTQQVAMGNLSWRVATNGQDEFAQLARAFNTMIDSLQTKNEENAQLHEEAVRMQEERIRLLRERFTQVVKAQEQERQRVARELHDQAGQALTALQWGLARLEKSTKGPKLQQELEGLRELTLETMDEVRHLALDLRPSILDELGIIPAIREYVGDYSRRFGLPVEMEVHELENRLPPETETVLFRVVQEGLTNIAKHAKASRAKVRLGPENGWLKVVVEDNGIGFDPALALNGEERRSLGLYGIQERVALLGGIFNIYSEPGKGTQLVILVPLSEDASLENGELFPEGVPEQGRTTRGR